MALQVWLPLSGNISNFGLSDAEAHVIGRIMYASGLFGNKCFKSGDGAVDLHIASFPSVFTLTMWLKPDSPAMNSTLIAFGDNGDSIDISTDTLTYKWNGGNIVKDNTTIFQANDGVWSHIAITADGRYVKAFVNGELVTTVDQSSTFAASDIYIGEKSDETGNWDGYIQDVKLYDYIISTRELKNMALGIALNYTFNHNGFGNENIMTGSCQVLHVEGEGKINRVENNKMYADLVEGTYTLSAVTTGVWTASNSSSGASVDPEHPELFPTALELYTVLNNEINARFFVDMTLGYGHINITTPGRYYLGGIVYGDGVTAVEADFASIKLEKGTVATAWIPPVGTEEYDYYEIGEIEQDTSGNGFDGNLSDPGPIWTDDSRLYTGAYDFSNNSYIESPVIDVNNLGKFTITVWAKANTYSGILFGFNAVPRFNFAVMNGVFGIYDNDTEQLLPFGSGEQASKYVGAWHFFTITGDGTSNVLYIDGKQIGTTQKYIPLGRSKLYINGWDSSINNNYNGLLSDFRIYAMVLTGDQINSLYHQRAAVDNTGKVYSHEFIGNATRFSINRNGVMRHSEFTVFDTPINENSVTTDDTSEFRVSSSKVSAVDMIEM